MSWLQHFIRFHSVIKYAGRFSQVADMQEAIALVVRCRITSEIIGRWLYCFTNPLIGCQLESVGFWHSVKHNAWVFTGYPKDDIPADGESLDEIRARLGSEQVRGHFIILGY